MLEERLSRLLRVVVDEYVASGEPIGSQYLVDRHQLEVSPATVRNWFVELEELGCLTQPHTSGGRIPTEKGFETYISLFVQSKPAPKRERDVLQKAASAPLDDGRRWKGVAKVLSELSGEAVVVGIEKADTYYTGLSQLFAQSEFKNWQQVVNLSEVLDQLDETLQRMRAESFEAPRILLGRHCPFGSACGLIVASNERGLVGILGPMRMEYQYSLSLMHSAWSLLMN